MAVTVTDDGGGFDPELAERRHGLDLGLMRRRVAELAGTFQLGCTPGNGTRSESCCQGADRDRGPDRRRPPGRPREPVLPAGAGGWHPGNRQVRRRTQRDPGGPAPWRRPWCCWTCSCPVRTASACWPRSNATGPSSEVLMLSSSQDEEHLLAAICAGAFAYLSKTAGVEQVVATVHAPARGESSLEPRLAARLVREVRQAHGPPPPPGPALPPRAGGPGRAGPRPLQPPDRPGPWDRRGDRQGARVQHPGQARARRPHPSRHLRPPAAPGPPRPGPRRIDNKSRRAPRGKPVAPGQVVLVRAAMTATVV